MPFLKLELNAGTGDPEVYEGALFAAGAASITLADAADDPVLEPAPGTTPLWPSVRIEALFDGETDPLAVTAVLEAMLARPLPSFHFSMLEDRSWEREWLKDFHPMRFGKRLWICPGGQRPSESDLGGPSGEGKHPSECEPSGEGNLQAAPVIVELDPGLAFGTGTHPTTALCLDWLDSADLTGLSVIDYGCGSGILAVAALKLGARSATGVDIDPQALTASRDNATRNQVAAHLDLRAAGEPLEQVTDVLVANILAEPLEALAGLLKDRVVSGGRIVLSGILTSQSDAVAERYGPWFDMKPATCRDGWARLEGTRRPHDDRPEE